MLTTGEARLVAAEWVRAGAASIPAFVGALLAGSARERAPDDPHPETSDLDVWIVVDAAVPDTVAEPEGRFAIRKLHHRGVLIERAFFPWERLSEPARVLGDVYVAPTLVAPALLADPSGRLERVAAAVGADFRRRSHVRRRVEGALALAGQFCDYAASGATAPRFDPLVSRAAGLGVSVAHAAAALAAAALLPPSNRWAFVRAGEVLRRHGRAELAEELLAALGSAGLGRAEVERAFAELERAYDAAVEVRRTPFGLDYNVAREARTPALGGIRALVAVHPREAMDRLLFLRSLVQNVLEHDASAAVRARFREGYVALLSAMGLDTDARRAARVAAIRAIVPRLRAACGEIIAATPGVVEDGG
ncbi:MAG TPA: hypothetical protein VEB43_12920 [Anaeromyxobacter sp.]|nr:hypothetical protein [Anaeromyxobacter sp.]